MSPPWTVTEQTSDTKGGATEESVLADDMAHWVMNLLQKKVKAPNSAFSNKIRTMITLMPECGSYRLMWKRTLFDMRIEITW